MYQLKKGDKVEVLEMPADSHYRAIRGKVEYVRNGWVGILATEVVTKWDDDDEFKPHLGGGCSTAAKREEVCLIG